MSQHYLIPRRLSNAFPGIRNVAWRFEALLLRCVFWLLGTLSLERSTKIASAMFRFLGPHLSRWRTARRNLALAFPDKDQQEIDELARGVFNSLGTAMTELIHMNSIWDEQDKRLEFVVEDGARSDLDQKQPAVYIIAHVGAWQLANFVAAHYDLRALIIYAPEPNPYLQEVFLKLRSAFPCRLVSRDGGMRSLIRELKAGNSIGLSIDTRLDGGEMIPFFGIDAPTNTAPARLALRYHCNLVPVLVERLPETRYRITVCTPIKSDDPAASVAEQAYTMTHKLNSLFEDWIRKAPDQWICLKRRWPKEAYKTAQVQL